MNASCPRCYSDGHVDGTEARCTVCNNSWSVASGSDQDGVARDANGTRGEDGVHEAIDGPPEATDSSHVVQPSGVGGVRGGGR